MSGRDNNPGAPAGQPKSAGVSRASQLRFALGVVSRSDLQAVMQVSEHTIAAWVSKGLKAFRPGTKEHLFLLSEVQEFLGRRETFAGRNKRPKRQRE